MRTLKEILGGSKRAAVVDLETFGVKPNAIMNTIGVSVIDTESLEVIEPSFYQRIDWRSLMNGFHKDLTAEIISNDFSWFSYSADKTGHSITKGTIDWWAKQSERAKEEIFSLEFRQPIREVLGDLSKFLADTEADCILGFGASFDNAILGYYYEHYKLPVPWHYRKSLCMRTLYGVYGNEKPTWEKVKAAYKDDHLPHIASYDAHIEANVLVEMAKAAL